MVGKLEITGIFGDVCGNGKSVLNVEVLNIMEVAIVEVVGANVRIVAENYKIC